MTNYYLGQVVLVGLGGFIGSSARFATNDLIHRVSFLGAFPFGTLLVNIIGCIAIGFLSGLMEYKSALGPGQKLFLIYGILGGFTTYSSFAYETFTLGQNAEVGKAIVNTVAHVALGLLAAWGGYVAAQNL